MDNMYYDEAIQLIRTPHGWKNREEMVTKYSWSIPTDTAISVIAKYCPLVEMGAGSGYWASLIKQVNDRIICFDKYIGADNPYKHYHHWTPIINGDHSVLEKFHSSTNLFLSWPPYGEPMAHDCLMSFKGKYLIYIGEDCYGCTGDDVFHDELNKNWNCIETIYLPQWYGLHDNLYIYKRA